MQSIARTNIKQVQKKGQTKKSVKVVDKMWIAYVYTFDKSLIDLMGKKIVQNSRNFVMKNK